VHRFTQVDVFTDELTYGNPVAVIHDADGASEQEMLAFARWTNLSETTFLSRPSDPRADYAVRIFTTQRELPFAGHPTLGSAHAWLEAGGASVDPELVIQECGAGLIHLRRDRGRLWFAAPPLRRGGPLSPDDLAEVVDSLGIEPSVVVDAQWADNGPPWVAVLLADADAVLSVRPRPARAGRIHFIGIVGPQPEGTASAFEVRAFVLSDGSMEDPATGSLNAAIGQWLIGTGRAPERYVAAQGTMIGRRGRIHVERRGTEVWVGGGTVPGVSGVTGW